MWKMRCSWDFQRLWANKQRLRVKLTTLIGIVAKCRPEKMQSEGWVPLRHAS